MHLDFTTAAILSLSIFIPGLIGIFRFHQIRSVYRPFIYLMWVGCINEPISIYLALHHHYTIVNGVIYALCESLLLLWFFKVLGVFKRHKNILYVLIFIFIATWVIENFFSKRFGTSFGLYFDIFYSLCVVLLSIRAINDLLFIERDLLKNPTFLICVGLIIFFTYEVINRMFWLYGLDNSDEFVHSVQNILMIINVLTNLIFALGILWMRKKQAFTLQF